MRVALAQINPASGDLTGNAAKILEAISAARQRGADLVVTPEMCLPGYCIGDLIENDAFVAANETAMRRIADAATDITAVVGFIDCDADARNEHGLRRRYNAAAVVRDGQVLQRAHKSLLPNYRYFDDKRFFSPAASRDPVTVPTRHGEVAIGVSICEDLWDEFYAVKPLQELAAKGAAVLLNINASPYYPGKRSTRERLIREHVRAVRRPIVYVNTVGAADNGKNIIPFDGESVAYDASGRLVAAGRLWEEDLLLVDLDAPGPSIDLPPSEREREMYDALVMSLGDYMRKVGFTRVIVPVSGGIDSALAVTIAVDTVGAGNVAAFNLPSRHNSYGVIPIQGIDECVRATFEEHAHHIEHGLTRENLHARIRGLLMMAESNDTGALLISCGNETEIALGYATLYGDMCGGLSLIGDLSKTDVYRLARHANARHGREIIPEDTFHIVPSAELAEGQFDPFDYAVVSPIVGEFMEHRTSPEALVRQFERRELDPVRFAPDDQGRRPYDKFTPESFRAVVYDCFRRMRRSVYKRLQGPPIVVVSERAFGFDLRETIINGWEG